MKCNCDCYDTPLSPTGVLWIIEEGVGDKTWWPMYSTEGWIENDKKRGQAALKKARKENPEMKLRLTPYYPGAAGPARKERK